MTKKHLGLILILTTLSLPTLAGHFEATIHSLSRGEPGEEHILKFQDGRVAFVDPSDGFDELSFERGQRVAVETTADLRLQGMSLLGMDLDAPEDPTLFEEGFLQPTVLSPEEAESVFRGMNRSWRSDTECSDRAQIWAWEEWKKRGLVSQKVFMFFTDRYIRTYRWHWWFHVAPFTLVENEAENVQTVLDPRFLRSPVSMKKWSDYFIRSKRACPETTYRHYRTNRRTQEHCFHVKSAMYYRLPLHVRRLEDNGAVKTRFSQSEINFSYRAFRRRL